MSKKVATAAGAGKANSIVVVKNFDTEERATVEFDMDITSANVDEFVSAEKLPLVIPFMEKNQEKIFDSGVARQVLLIADGKDLKKGSEILEVGNSRSEQLCASGTLFNRGVVAFRFKLF